MAKEKMCGIYCIRNIANNKMYIGQSVDIYGRRTSHYCALKNNNHTNEKLQNAWNKYGQDNFEFYIIIECDKDQLDDLERYYIALYDTYKNGYNKTTGGQDNFTFSDDVREMLSKIRKNPNEQVRENMRRSQASRPIYQIDFNGNIVREWYGAREASTKLHINQSALWQCLHHKRLTLSGYIWVFVDEFDEFNLLDYLNKNTQSKAIAQMDLDGIIVHVWESANSARKFGFDPSCIIKCCKGKKRQYKGFLWSYYDNIRAGCA